MGIRWNEQTFRWLQCASEYTGYNKKLAALLLEIIPAGSSLCDLACGAGLIDMELAASMETITCVDISQNAINYVAREIEDRQIGNIEAVCCDAADVRGQWDTVTMMFFSGEGFIEKYFHLAKEQLVVLTHGQRRGKFGPEGHQIVKCSDIDSTKAYLDGLGISYTARKLTMEYGQPLMDLEDAKAFVKTYSQPMEPALLDAYLAEKLEKTGDDRYPYYLPNPKEFGLFIIRRDKNAAAIESLNAANAAHGEGCLLADRGDQGLVS